jgi:putative transcriptional regulator
MRALAACLALMAAFAAAAQPQTPTPANGLFLIAKPELADPNFSRTVVLVTQAQDASTVGVIINRPSALRLSQFEPGTLSTEHYRDPIFLGGPVMRHALLAVFRASETPRAAAFHVLKGLYLTLHQDNVAALLADPQARYRLYAGFAGWAPRQLESEMERGGWFMLPADEATIFRNDMTGLWEELVSRARGPRASLSGN